MRRFLAAALLVATTLLILAAILIARRDDEEERDRPATATPIATTVTPAPFAPFDAQAAYSHVRALADDIGVRESGSAAERRAAEYLRDRYAAAGYRVELQQFTFSFDRTASVQVDGRPLDDVRPLLGAISGEATGPIRFIGLGRESDIPPGGLRGFIALADRGAIAFGAKAGNAEAEGALALIVINQSAEPLTGSLLGPSPIPVVTAPQEQRQRLLDAEASGTRVTVRIINRSQQSSQNVIARPPSGECQVIVGGHYDSVPGSPGANDNASGAAVTLAVAETRAARGQRDHVCYLAFGAHEFGPHGGTHYAYGLTAEDIRMLRGVVNLDMVGVGNDTWKLIGSESMQTLSAQVAAGIDIATTPFELPDQYDSDHTPFIQRGVPALFLHRRDDPNYHKPTDRTEFVRPESLGQAGNITLGVIDRLLVRP